MTIDPRQMQAFLGLDQPGRPADEYSAGLRADAQQVARLTSSAVNYFEISRDASGFSCGDCQFGTPVPRAFCTHQSVQAPISPKRGCCNLFSTATSQRVWP